MQDLSTGELKPMSPEIAEALRKIPEKKFESPFERQLGEVAERLQAERDRVIPVRAHQGPTFFVGEEVEVKGGRFRVQAITDKRLYLDSLPAR